MLQSILHGTDNNERRAVEAQLISSLSDATTLFSLVHLLMDQVNVPTGVRHLAAVLLRKRILTLWKALDDSTKVEIKALFLQQLGNEETKVVRFAIAHIVTRIAKVGWDAEEDGGKSAGWPELVQAIRVAADDPRPAMRELSMVLLFSVCEVFADENALANLAAETVVRGVMDEEEVVCRAAIKAGITLLPCLYGKAALRREFLSHLIPQCIAQLTRYCVVREKVGLCVMFLDLLEECLEEVSAAKQAALLTTLIQAILDFLLHRGVHLLIRENCGSFLAKVVQQKQKFALSHGFLPLLVRAGGQLMAEDASVGTLDGDVVKNSRIIGEGDEDTSAGDGEGGDDAMGGEDDDDDEEVDMLNAQNACMIGRQLLSALSSSLSSKTFTHEVMAMVEELKLLVSTAPSNVLPADPISIPSSPPLSSSSSSSCYPYPKKSIIFTLASLSESNPGYLRRRVGEVVQLTEQYLTDPDPVTREAVSASLPWFCLHLQPEVLTHHQRLFPILIPLLEDNTDRVRRQAALALEVLCEHAADYLEPYVHPLVTTILLHLSTSSLLTQKNMCSVLSSIAAAKTQSFQPFAAAVLELLLQAVQMTAPNALPLRARAVETVGVVAISMGKEAFSPYLPHFIGHVVDNFKQDDPLLREYSFGFLCNVCEMLEQDFLPYMEDTIQCAIHTIEQDRSVYKNKHLLTKDAPSLGQFPSRPFRLSEDQALQTKSHHYDPETGIAMPSAASPTAGAGGEKEKPSDSDEEGSEEEIHMRVRTADIEEKSAAVYAIGVVAKVMGAAMGDERLTICWETLAALDDHFYPEIRANALIALGKLATASHGNGGVVEKLFSSDTLRAFTRRLVDTLLYQMLLPCIENEQEKDVVQAALETLTSLLQFFGPQCLLFGPDDVIRDCIQIMRVKMPCQKDDLEESEGEDSEEDLDHDGGEKGKSGDVHEKREDGMAMFETDALQVGSDTNVASWTTTLDPSRILQHVNLPEDHDDEVLEGTMDCLEAVFEVYHQQAIPYAKYVIPLLLRYADPSERSSEDVVMAVGTFACLLESMGTAACESYFETAMQVAAGVMQHSEESSARSNAAYTLKVLLENCPERFHPENGAYLQQTMALLWAIVRAGTETASSGGVENGVCGTEGNQKEEIPEAVDNAVSATCSLVRCLPPFHLPLETILPVLFSHLPMRVDQTENKNAVHTLVYLYASPSTQVLLQEQATSPTWLPAFFHATLLMLQSRSVPANEKNMLAAEGVQVFMTNYPSMWMQAPEDLQNLIGQWQASSSVA